MVTERAFVARPIRTVGSADSRAVWVTGAAGSGKLCIRRGLDSRSLCASRSVGQSRAYAMMKAIIFEQGKRGTSLLSFPTADSPEGSRYPQYYYIFRAVAPERGGRV
jgi:hypothetical protein